MRGAGRRFGTVKFVAVVENARGKQFMVFTTGDDRFYRFQPIDELGCATMDSFLVEKKRLATPIKRALANGWGNSYIGKYSPGGGGEVKETPEVRPGDRREPAAEVPAAVAG